MAVQGETAQSATVTSISAKIFNFSLEFIVIAQPLKLIAVDDIQFLVDFMRSAYSPQMDE